MISHQTIAAVQRRVWKLLALAGVTPPVDDRQLDRVARLQGATILESGTLGSLHGAISLTGKGMVIRVNRCLTPAERRYAIAHEIGHILIDADIPFPRHRMAARIDPPLAVSPGEREHLCDWIAGELLVPQPEFLAALYHEGDPTSMIRNLASEYGIPDSGIVLQLEAVNRMQLRFDV